MLVASKFDRRKAAMKWHFEITHFVMTENIFMIMKFTENATRWCDELGRWNKTNYEECRELETTDNGSAVIYYTGYSISLIALSIAVFIFLYYR